MRHFIFFISIVILAACGGDSGKKRESAQGITSNIPEEQAVENNKQEKSEKMEQMDETKEVIILIKTPYGNMKGRLYSKTPKHRDNFVKLMQEGWYNNSPFHRVINRFMIQGGQNANGTIDIGYTIPAEFVPEYIHKKGALAAARTADQINPRKESSGNQFYIVQGKTSPDSELALLETRGGFQYTTEHRDIYKTLGGTPFLDYNYTVFGEIFEGLEVIDKIASVQTDNADRPVAELTMKIEIIEQ